jgi:hypothetical protein
MISGRLIVLTAVCVGLLSVGVARGGQTTTATASSLTALDYIEIRQLVSRYARAVVRCTNSGYDYADLYVQDGWFAPTRDGNVGQKWQGRERLAEAAGGGKGGCRDVAWAGVTHILTNQIITPSPEGARGEVDLVAVGVDGDPRKVEAQGHYEDVYVKTPAGWRFQSRVHHLSPRQRVTPPPSSPR